MRILLLCLLTLGSAACNGSQQQANNKLGVGDAAPDFQLKSAAGEDVSLAALKKKHKMLAFVFIRSADW